MSDNTIQRIKVLAQIRDPFGRIPNIVIDFYGAAMGKAGWLYTLLTRFSNGESSESFASVRTLAATGGIDTKTVQAWAEQLENLGLLRVEKDETWAQEKRRPRSNTYILLLPPLPPTPETIKAHFPAGWTPQPRALKALESIRNFLTLDTTPQEGTNEGGSVGTTPTDPSPPVTPPAGGSVGTTPTLSRSSSHAPSEPLPRNKLSLTSEPEQENNNSVVVDDVLTGLTAKLKPKTLRLRLTPSKASTKTV